MELKWGHFEHLQVNDEVSTRHHYREISKTFPGSQHAGMPLKSACTLPHTVQKVNMLS